jgi:hypothetical protein
VTGKKVLWGGPVDVSIQFVAPPARREPQAQHTSNLGSADVNRSLPICRIAASQAKVGGIQAKCSHGRLVKLAIRSDVSGPLERLERRLRFGSPFAVDPAGLESHIVESLLDLADLPCAQPIWRNPLSICRNGRLGLRLKGLGYLLAVQA